MNVVFVCGLFAPFVMGQVVAPVRIAPIVPGNVGSIGAGATNLNSSLRSSGLTSPDLSSSLRTTLPPASVSGSSASIPSGAVPLEERPIESAPPATIVVPPPPSDHREPPPDGGDDDDEDDKDKPRAGIQISGTQFVVGLLVAVFLIGYFTGNSRRST